MLLRPRQHVFVERTMRALTERGNALAVAPTGFGKTVALAAIIGRLLATGGRALVLQHRGELLAQNVATFETMNPEVATSVVDAGAKDFDGRVIFSMVPTLARPATLSKLPPVDVLVIDEAHHAPAKTYRRIVDRAKDLNPDVVLLGLTATARRADRKALRSLFDNVSDQVLVGELIQSGHLVRPRTYVIDLGLQDELLAVKRRVADFDPGEVDAILNHQPLNRSVVGHWREKAGNRQTVAFTSTVAHAEELAAAFRAEGFRAAAVHGDMADAERRSTLAAYDAGRLQVVTNCFVLGEGWDHPPTSAVLLLRPTSFKSTWTQMVGRGLRPVDPQRHPGVVKADCVVLDFGVSTILHGTLEQNVDLDARLAAVARNREGDGVLTKECPACGAEVPLVAAECPMCGERLIDDVTRLLNFELVEVDLLDKSNFAWTDVSRAQDGGSLAVTGFESWAVVVRDGAHWAAVGGLKTEDGQRTASVIATGDRAVCLARADDFVNEHESAETAHRTRGWTKQPPTEKQLKHLPAWARSTELTRYEASCHLTEKFNARRIERALALPEQEVA